MGNVFNHITSCRILDNIYDICYTIMCGNSGYSVSNLKR